MSKAETASERKTEDYIHALNAPFVTVVGERSLAATRIKRVAAHAEAIRSKIVIDTGTHFESNKIQRVISMMVVRCWDEPELRTTAVRQSMTLRELLILTKRLTDSDSKRIAPGINTTSTMIMQALFNLV